MSVQVTDFEVDSILDKLFEKYPKLVKPILTELPIKYHMSASIEMECNSRGRENARNRATILTREMFGNWNVIGEKKLTKSFLYKLDTSKDVSSDILSILLETACNLDNESKYKTITTGEVKKKFAFKISIPDEDRNRTIDIDFNYNKYIVITKTSTYVLHIEIFAVPDINLPLQAIRYQRNIIMETLNNAITLILDRIKENENSEIVFTNNAKLYTELDSLQLITPSINEITEAIN